MKRGLALLLALAAFGCNNGQESAIGPGQPFRVRGAQFMAGELPGTLPDPDAGAPMPEEGGPPLVTAARTAKQFLTYVNAGPFQHAVVAGLALDDAFFHQLAASLAAKRDLLCDGLEKAGFVRLREDIETIGTGAGKPTVYLMLEQPKWT